MALKKQKIDNQATMLTPCEWLIQLAEGKLSSSSDTEPMIRHLLTAKSYEKERQLYFLQYILKETIQTVPIGLRGRDFIDKTDVYCHFWQLPYTHDKAESIARILSHLDKDLTNDRKWPKFQSILAQLREKAQDAEALESIIQQILTGYKNHVIHHTFFHERSIDETALTFQLNDLHHKEIFYRVTQAMSRCSFEDVYADVCQQCQSILTSETDSLVSFAKMQCKNGQYFVHVAYHLQQQISTLKKTPEYEFLQDGSEALSQAIIFLADLKEIMARLNSLFQDICHKAKPGIIIESDVIEAINHLVKEPVFLKMVRLGPEAIAHYMNSRENIKYVHDMVMRTRTNACKAVLHDERALKQEIQKITNYRVRRNVLEHLFDFVLYDLPFEDNSIWPGAQISVKQEALLLMIQHEFLQALNRQAEDMISKEALVFFEGFRYHKMIQPLPRTHSLAKKNAITLREYDLLLQSFRNNTRAHLPPKEDPTLHHIDCPIEQDIIGEMTKRLVDVIAYRIDNWQGFHHIMEITQQTYKKLLHPDFKSERLLEDFVLDSRQQNKLVSFLENEKNVVLRLERLLELYDYVCHSQKQPKTAGWLAHKIPLKMSEQEKAIQFLQRCYIDIVQEFINITQHDSDHDKLYLYERILLPALESRLFNDVIAQKVTQQAKRQLIALQEKLL